MTSAQRSQFGQVIFVLGGKGGVGKTTIATGLAFALARIGRVGLLDADLSGPSVPTLLSSAGTIRVAGERMLPLAAADGDASISVMSTGYFGTPDKAFAWHGPLMRGAFRQLLDDTDWGELDYMVVDTPPGTSELHSSLVSLLEPEVAVMVTTSHPLALSDTRRSIEFFRGHVPIGAFVNNMSSYVCATCGTAAHRFHADSMLATDIEHFDVPFFPGHEPPWREPAGRALFKKLARHLAASKTAASSTLSRLQ